MWDEEQIIVWASLYLGQLLTGGGGCLAWHADRQPSLSSHQLLWWSTCNVLVLLIYVSQCTLDQICINWSYLRLTFPAFVANLIRRWYHFWIVFTFHRLFWISGTLFSIVACAVRGVYQEHYPCNAMVNNISLAMASMDGTLGGPTVSRCPRPSISWAGRKDWGEGGITQNYPNITQQLYPQVPREGGIIWNLPNIIHYSGSDFAVIARTPFSKYLVWV